MKALQTWTLWALDFLDHFDLALYGFLASLIGSLFFPHHDPLTQSISSYGLFWASSLVAYPAGSLIFGFLAGRFSPEAALRWAALGLSLSTFTVGLLPTYAAAGFWAALFLVTARSLQCIFARGERVISHLYLIRSAPSTHALMLSVRYEVLMLLGIILASCLASWILSCHSSFPQAWRVPFLVSGALSAFIFMRRPSNLQEANPRSALKLPPLKFILAVVAVTGPSYVPYAVVFQFLNSFIPLVMPVSAAAIMKNTTFFLLLDLGLVVGAAFLLRKSATPPKIALVMTTSALVLALTSLPLFAGLALWPTWSYLFFLRLWLVVWGVIYALPMTAWLSHFAKGPYQYLFLGLGTTLGTVVLGHSTSFVCLCLYRLLKVTAAPSLYLVGVCLFSLWGHREIKSGKFSLEEPLKP